MTIGLPPLLIEAASANPTAGWPAGMRQWLMLAETNPNVCEFDALLLLLLVVYRGAVSDARHRALAAESGEHGTPTGGVRASEDGADAIFDDSFLSAASEGGSAAGSGSGECAARAADAAVVISCAEAATDAAEDAAGERCFAFVSNVGYFIYRYIVWNTADNLSRSPS